MSMQHEYYGYDKERLLQNPAIPLIVMKDNEAVYRAMAEEMAEEIKRKNRLGERCVLICPVGPVGQYPYFVELVNREGISLKNVWFINMDEYLTPDGQWLPVGHRLSFRGFMERNVYAGISPGLIMPREQRVFPDPARPEYIRELTAGLGGVDICFGGIGINGHVAFNEPQEAASRDEFLALGTRALEIAPETRVTNSIGDLNGALEDMPRYCVTVGFHEIAQAGKIRLGCFRDWHRGVVRRAVYGDSSPSFPVSLLREHKDINIRLTEFVAALPE